ncbi:four helix bundle protein [Thalassotalea ponticola]|uniref:four helix bundle protein n=1 Tax=Thalassotalea ponticola TaxID=1523392 RepID=UPI0025B48B24|nr:four helix bundle protein [Thalassotalea ponticola]MDN3652665.1 four helix bundle protein [Thalassotalea ponticola]
MNYEKLIVWKQSVQLSAALFKHFKCSNDFGFKDQITRSGLSIPSNIAEGMARESVKEKAHFLAIAKGSCAELKTQIIIGIEIDYIERDLGNRWLSLANEIDAMLTGLRNRIRSV